MKKYSLIFVLIWPSFLAFSQTADDYINMVRDILKTEKKAAVAEGMNLTDAEITPFWNLYNEYNAKLSQTQNKRIALIKEYAAHFDSMTDEKADEIMLNYMKYQQELLKLKKYYYGRFKKILPESKAARYFQLENKLQTLVDAQLALEIPLVEVK